MARAAMRPFVDATSVTSRPGGRASRASSPRRSSRARQASGGAASTTRSASASAAASVEGAASTTPDASARAGPAPDGVQAAAVQPPASRRASATEPPISPSPRKVTCMGGAPVPGRRSALADAPAVAGAPLGHAALALRRRPGVVRADSAGGPGTGGRRRDAPGSSARRSGGSGAPPRTATRAARSCRCGGRMTSRRVGACAASYAAGRDAVPTASRPDVSRPPAAPPAPARPARSGTRSPRAPPAGSARTRTGRSGRGRTG